MLKIRICKSIFLPVVLHGCGTWSLILRGEYRMRIFENRVFRRIFGLKTNDATGGWKKLHNEELRDLYSSPSIIRITKSRRMLRATHVARIGRRGKSIGFGRKARIKEPTIKTKNRWVHSI
jgi:hypothetical protein